ncbi:MAG: cysteine desulfurase family protein [bacterium]
MIYLDYAASTPLDPRVIEVMRNCEGIYGNPSSQHAEGRKARAIIDNARDDVAAYFNAKSSEIIFTSGGTESDNLAIKGVAMANRKRGNHIVTTTIEHHAVLETCAALECGGFKVTYVKPDKNGLISPQQISDAITSETILVSVMAANNEIGTIQPIGEIAAICKEKDVLFHTDAVQAAGEIRIDIAQMPVDLISISAHKIYGPKGIGALYVRSGTRITPHLHGGQQETGRRAGTEQLPAIAGFAAAVKILPDAVEINKIRKMRNSFIREIADIPGIRFHGDMKNRLAGNINFAIAGITGEKLMMALDLRGICVSTGAACAAGAVGASHVITALGYTPTQSAEAIRISIGRGTTADEMRETALVIREIVIKINF